MELFPPHRTRFQQPYIIDNGDKIVSLLIVGDIHAHMLPILHLPIMSSLK